MVDSSFDTFWIRRPSLIVPIIRLVFLIVVIIPVWVKTPIVVMYFYQVTAWLPIWPDPTQERFGEVIKNAWVVLRGILSILIVTELIGILRVWVTRYELSPGQFLYHHGLLVRTHDEIELHRIRDFRVVRPLLSRIFGLGKIHMITRDETWPELVIGPFPDAREVANSIREQVEIHKRATGFREFESH